MREDLILSLLGTGLGLPLALGAGRLFRAVLFGVVATDLKTFALAAAAFAVVGVTARARPARRASSADLMTSLRAE